VLDQQFGLLIHAADGQLVPQLVILHLQVVDDLPQLPNVALQISNHPLVLLNRTCHLHPVEFIG
jgi:hypothetical protein